MTSVRAATSVRAGMSVRAARLLRAGTSVRAAKLLRAATSVRAGMLLRAATLASFACSAACGTAAGARSVDLAGFFTADGVEEARREAPDLVVAAELARDEAERADAAGEEDAASDHATRSRLLLEAALVETERARLDRERVELLAEAERATAEAEALEAERVAIATTARRNAAAEIVRVQMQNAHAAAERLEGRGRRHRGADVDRTRREAAVALEERTRLLVVAARALGASDEELAPLELTTTETPSDPAERLARADERHRSALALLGRRRAERPVGPEVVGSLVEAARELGLEPSMRPEGLAVVAPSARALADLGRAFPHGAIGVLGRGARALARATNTALGEERCTAEESAADPIAVFTAYGAR